MSQRSLSSLSVRPTPTRPQSRFSQRPHSRQARSRLVPICQTLVTLITGLREDGENDPETNTFREKVEYAVKILETTTMVKAAASAEISIIDRQISGHSLKARINSRDALGKALEVAYSQLTTHVSMQESDLDHDIKTTRIPDHLQFLLALSQPPTDDTEAQAKAYLEAIANPPPPLPKLTWTNILAEEPFYGDHWEGIYPFTTTPLNMGHENEWDSDNSLSPLNSDDLALDDESDSSSIAYDEHSQPAQRLELKGRGLLISARPQDQIEHRKEFEELQSRQYWRDEWHTDAPLWAQFDIGDPSTLGPTLNRVLAKAGGFHDAQAMLKPERYVGEDNMVREILMALQGNRNIVLKWSEGAFKLSPNTPRLIHLSLASQESIISSLARTATTLEHLRRFAAAVFSTSISHSTTVSDLRTFLPRKDGPTRTCEAFADAIDQAIRAVNAWCASREEAICRAYKGIDEEPFVASLLCTEKALRDGYGTSFDVLFDIVGKVFPIRAGDASRLIHENRRQSPAVQTAILLNTLFDSIQRHIERRDTVTSGALINIFVRTVEPIWGMMGNWLRNGMVLPSAMNSNGNPTPSCELYDEFFIESNGIGHGMGVGLLDPEFWNEGYSLKEVSSYEIVYPGDQKIPVSTPTKAIPHFLERVADLVLGTGKAAGLLRVLDAATPKTFSDWNTFAEVVASESYLSNTIEENNGGLFSVSSDALSRSVYDRLLPRCQAIGKRLVQVLVNDCVLWKHLAAIEDLYLMRKGDAMSHFLDIVFSKMDSQQPWGDYHFLNTAFNEVAESNAIVGTKEWINPSLVRLSYRGSRNKDQSIKRTVRAIDCLSLEYSVPVPLIYVFQPKDLKVYNEIFLFLFQIRRSKNVLERILVRDECGRGKRLKDDVKMFYAMRSRLSWFVNTLLNFLTTQVIRAEVARFHEGLETASSLDEMIHLHGDHLGKIQSRCLLKPNTSALHRAILSVLDMCLHFSEGFMAFAGDSPSTLDVSRQSLNIKRHRSRAQRQHRRNVIGFLQSLQDSLSSGDEDEDVDTAIEPSISMLEDNSLYSEGNFFVRVERMSSELDGLVRFLRRGIETLAGGTSEAAPAFGVLAFSLQDWDI